MKENFIFPETLTPSEKEKISIFNKFSPKHKEAGLIFSATYVGYVKGIFFKKYYVLKMVTGDTLGKDTYIIENWCDIFYKVKDRSDMICFLKQMKKLAEKKDALSRVSFETSFGVPL